MNKTALQSQFDFLVAEIIRLENIAEPLNQEIEDLNRRLDQVREKLKGA
jgi:prefoldin subunit 5